MPGLLPGSSPDASTMHLIPSCWRMVPTHPLVAAVEQELARRGHKALADDLDDLPALVRLASRLAPRLRRQFLDAVLASRNSIDLDALAQAVLSGNLTSIEAAAKLSSVSSAAQAVEPILRQGFLLGAQYALEAAQLTLRLDLVNPYATQWAASHAAELVTEISRETGIALRSIIEAAFTEGRSPYETARAIRDVVGLTSRQAAAVETFRARLLEDGVDPAKVASRTEKYSTAQLRWRSENIARTETLTASNNGQQGLWQEAKRQGLLDPERTRRVWIVTPDDLLDTEICEPLDGAETTLDEPFPGGIMSPPAHPSCVSGDTFITPGGRITGVSKRWYDGELLRILMTGDNVLCITPNHPILTPHGWRAAGQLEEGSDVVSYAHLQGMSSLLDDDNPEMEISAEEIASTLFRSGQMASAKMPVTAEDFHGDGGGSQIAVIGTYGQLRNNRNSTVMQPMTKETFILRTSAPSRSFNRQSLLALRCKTSNRSARCTMGRLHLMSTLSRRHARPFEGFRLRSTSWLNALLKQRQMNGRSTNGIPLGQSIDGIPALIQFNKILEIRRVPFSGHVYNFETSLGWYTANGIIAHNCRCTTALKFLE